ncbi:MAG: SIS domain-containing protein [Christensenellales bacterium]
MLNIDKSEVDFLVTEEMVPETSHVLENVFPLIDDILHTLDKSTIDRIYFVACGSPLCACETAAQLADTYGDFCVKTFSAMDFVLNPPYVINRGTLVIGVSDSGNTEEVVRAIELARKKGAPTIAVMKTEESPLAKAAEHVVAYHAECIWIVHALIGYHLVLHFLKETPELKQIKEELHELPGELERLLVEVEAEMEKWGARASKWDLIYTVSSGNLLPIGYKEGIITMLEFTWTHGCNLNSSEFRHGPLEVVEADTNYVFFLGRDKTRPSAERALRFVEGLTDNVIVFDSKKFSDKFHPALDPFLIFVPLEYFYYYLSIYKGHNPDDRRYYGGLREY